MSGDSNKSLSEPLLNRFRVLEEGQLERLGSTKSRNINVRIIVATNRTIEHEVKKGTFRQDLFYRLNVFPITVPPLRDRADDIPLLANVFVRKFQKQLGKEIERIPRKTMQALVSYSWPGNVRELRNIIERAMILSNDKILVIELPKHNFIVKNASGNLEDTIRSAILAALKLTQWRIAGKDGAAEVLGLKKSTLYSKMKKLGIRRTDC